MIADILFLAYIVFLGIVAIICIDPELVSLQQEYWAWRETKHYLASQGIRWP